MTRDVTRTRRSHWSGRSTGRPRERHASPPCKPTVSSWLAAARGALPTSVRSPLATRGPACVCVRLCVRADSVALASDTVVSFSVGKNRLTVENFEEFP